MIKGIFTGGVAFKATDAQEEGVADGKQKYTITDGDSVRFIVPKGVTVIKAETKFSEYLGDQYAEYVGVTAGKAYTLSLETGKYSRITSQNGIVWAVVDDGPAPGGSSYPFTLSWSEEINQHSVTVEDY